MSAPESFTTQVINILNLDYTSTSVRILRHRKPRTECFWNVNSPICPFLIREAGELKKAATEDIVKRAKHTSHL